MKENMKAELVEFFKDWKAPETLTEFIIRKWMPEDASPQIRVALELLPNRTLLTFRKKA